MSDNPLPLPDEHINNNGSPTPPKPEKVTIPGGIPLTPEMIAQLSQVNAATIAQAQADALENGGLLAELLFAKKERNKK